MMEAAELRAESIINCVCKNNFSDSFATDNIDVKQILSDFCSSFVAIEAISYDMSGYTSRIEAEDMINILRDSSLRSLSLLRDKKQQKFINSTNRRSSIMEHDFKANPELTNAEMNTFYFESPHKQIVRDFDAKVCKGT